MLANTIFPLGVRFIFPVDDKFNVVAVTVSADPTMLLELMLAPLTLPVALSVVAVTKVALTLLA